MPPNVTPLIQPMDQNVICLTKLYYKKHPLLLAVGKDDITQFLKHLTLKDAVSFLMLAWYQPQANVIVKCWKPLLEFLNTTEANESEDEYFVLLRQKILQEKWEEVHDIHGLMQVVLPEEIYTEQDIEKWNSIQVDEEID
ncbi:tigger transposable element-derived protein 2-like [Zeugodacus cucurbitae]|uniref:tigger transposable element-derived protein 2-like n=1 Tax=Zeugodacus cucurbitae TaxID=28588 RepID=UPI0023D8E1DA|nr:tigger transposable element-derived protein 2-like [Zeugodacus cucurbitae]